MRRVGELDKRLLEKLISYLGSQKIEVQAREGAEEEKYELWVFEEQDLERTKRILSEYLVNPTDKKYSDKKYSATSILDTGVKKTRSRYIDVRTQVFHRSWQKQGRITLFLLVFSVLVFFLRKAVPALDGVLVYSNYIKPPFKEIMEGEVWRLLTPIFLHFSFFHIVFNMLWLHVLGRQIELREGARYYVVLLVTIAIVSNTSQYLLSNSIFGGFSGVVYGMLGYIWMMSKFRPSSGYEIDNFTIGLMVVWLVLGIVGFVGNIANAAHVFGFVAGIVWGLLASGQFWRRGRREL